MGKVTNCKDLILLLLHARGSKGEVCEPIRGRTRLVKMVFLFDKEVRKTFNLKKNIIPDSVIPDFKPDNFGPFAGSIYSDLEFLVETGFVDVSSEGADSGQDDAEYEYWLANSGEDPNLNGLAGGDVFKLSAGIGKRFVEEGHAGTLTDEQRRVLEEFKARCTSVSLKVLLQYVYSRYPEMTTKSKIRGAVLGAEPSE